MRLPIEWLRAYVAPPPVDVVSTRLTAIGHMLDGAVLDGSGGALIPLEIRQNRPDCLSILGLAREVAAACDLPLLEPALADLPPVSGILAASDDHLLLLRLDGVTLERLPDHLLAHLEAYGQRSVSPLVDLGNYVMLEIGQPLHVYAAAAVDLPTMTARPGRAGETLALLDGSMAALAPDDLIIADCHGPLALAGVMGGADSAVATGATTIVVEAGTFRPHLVRRTARHHGIHTEASRRSSKLLAAELATYGLRRFLALLCEYGVVEDVELWRTALRENVVPELIRLEYADILRIGGMDVTPVQAVAVLEKLGFAVTIGGTEILATPPWWRTDVSHPADLIEEILRIVGYEQIPPLMLPALPPLVPEASAWSQEEQVRNLLCAWGYDEAILDSFVLDRGEDCASPDELLRVANPPAGSGILRPALLPNLLGATRYLPLLTPRRRLYEIGHVFRCHAGEPQELRAVAWVLVRGAGGESWLENGESHDLYTLKAEALALLKALGVHVGSEVTGTAPFPYLTAETVELRDGAGRSIGYVGVLDHQAYGTTAAQTAYGVELLLPPPQAPELARRSRRAVERCDLSAVLTNGATATSVRDAINEILGDDAIEVALIDRYQASPKQPASVTYRVIYAAERGTPQVVGAQLRALVEARLGVKVRG